VPVTVK
jgi:hypothetical protein